MENFTELLKNLACQNTLDFSWQQCSAELLKVAHNLGNQLYLYSGLEMQNCQLQKLTWHLAPATWPSTIRQIPDLGQICGFATVCGKIEMHDCGIVTIFLNQKRLTQDCWKLSSLSSCGWMVEDQMEDFTLDPSKTFSSRNFNFSGCFSLLP